MTIRTLFLLFLFTSTILSAQEQFTPAQIIEKVVAQNMQDQSYALYLPKGYTPGKKWPILYCFNARQNGKYVVGLFREAADIYGYIIASSNNSRSDDPTAPNIQAMQAMWEDTHQRFSINDQRAYATGFSGGARVACDMGYRYSGKIAGVITCGAGFPVDKTPAKDTPFVVYGTIGNRDFNYREMRLLVKAMTAAGLPHHIEVFDGEHQWPPATICTKAIEWMEIQAMKDQKREVDQEILQRLYEKAMQEAKKLEAEGKIYEASERYKQIATDFQSLISDLEAPESKAKELENSEALKKSIQDQERRDLEDAEYGKRLQAVIQAMRAPGDTPLSLNKIRNGLNVDALKQKAAELGNSEEGLAIQRRLESVFVEMSYYLPVSYMQREQFQRAVVALSIASEIKPNDPDVWYDLACAQSMNGDRAGALQSLKKAIDNGFANLERLQNDIDLKAIRGEKEFKELLKRVEQKSKKSG